MSLRSASIDRSRKRARADKPFEPSRMRAQMLPILGDEIDDRETRRRKFLLQSLARLDFAGAHKRDRYLMDAGIVANDQQRRRAFSVSAISFANILRCRVIEAVFERAADIAERFRGQRPGLARARGVETKAAAGTKPWRTR